MKEYKRQHCSFERPRLGKCLLCCTRDSGHVIQLPKNINWINIQFSLLINRLNSENFFILDFQLEMAILGGYRENQGEFWEFFSAYGISENSSYIWFAWFSGILNFDWKITKRIFRLASGLFRIFGNETWIWLAPIVGLQKSFELILNSDPFPGK